MDELLPLVKVHVRCERDDEDDYLEYLINAGIASFETFTGQTLKPSDTLAETLDENEVPLRMDILHGLLLLIGQWYEYRENVVDGSVSQMPEATERRWRPYVLYHLGDTP